MTIRASIPTHFVDDSNRSLAQYVHSAVRSAHQEEPFASSLHLSEWLHAQLNNPRLCITTADNGSTITIAVRHTGDTLITFHCNPTY